MSVPTPPLKPIVSRASPGQPSASTPNAGEAPPNYDLAQEGRIWLPAQATPSRTSEHMGILKRAWRDSFKNDSIMDRWAEQVAHKLVRRKNVGEDL